MLFTFKMLKLCIHYKIKPICIFDGRPHDGKVNTERGRSKAKAENKAMMAQARKEGDKDAAYKYNTRSLSIKSR
jgi:5'-3' exonuclease